MRVENAELGTFDSLLNRWKEFDDRIRNDSELSSFQFPEPVTIGVIAADAGEKPRGLVISADQAGPRVLDPARGPSSNGGVDTAMRAPSAAWDECLKEVPSPTFHHFLAMLMRVDGADIGGDERVFAQHAHVARRVVEVARELVSGNGPAASSSPELDRADISGRYVSVSAENRTFDIYVEEAGTVDKPVLFVLHTAGADSRQAHALMADRTIASRYRVIAFDMPGHGRSETLAEVFGTWTLTTERYVEIIRGVISRLTLDRPILVGASMAGEACLAMALDSPGLVGGVIACEAAEHVPGRSTPWPKDPRVNSMIFTPEWIDGLIAPTAPDVRRREIRQQYSQGGYGIFPGDIDFYSGDWDARGRIGDIDTQKCPVVMLTGEYDYSCTPEMSERTARRIRGAEFWKMPDLGHFPVCENPDVFSPHLNEALRIIERKRHG